MRFIDKIELIERVNNLIRRKVTGSPKDLANKLEISERAVYDIINLMKSMGAPIYFCQIKNSYRYEYDVEFSIGFLPTHKEYDIPH